MIQLTDEQVKALAEGESPPRAINPRTQDTFVLVRPAVYELARGIIEGYNRRGWDDPELDDYDQP